MIVNKKTLDSTTDTEEFQRMIDTFKGFENIGIIDLKELRAILKYKIVGRKTLEFCIIMTQDGEMIADITNKVIMKELPTFKWGTAKAFSKTLVAIHNWDKLTMNEDGEFKI
jgi:hypothetical protein